MYYGHGEMKIIHWDFGKDIYNISEGQPYFHLEYNLHEIINIPNEWTLKIRWRFRFYENHYAENDNNYICSLIGEQDVRIHCFSTNNDKQSLIELFDLSEAKFKEQLERLKKENNLNPLIIYAKKFVVADQYLQELLDNLNQK